MLNRIRIPSKQEPFPIDFLWFQRQSFVRDSRRISKHMHRHTFYEVHFPYSGQVTYTLDDGSAFTIGEGEYLFLPPGLDHRFFECTDNYGRFSFAFSVSDKDMTERGLSLPDGPVCRPVSEGMQHALQLARLAATRGDSLVPVFLRETLFLLVLLLAEKNQYAVPTPLSEDPRLLRAKQFIADNRTRALTVSEVAAFVHLSERQFARLFVNEEGITPLQYIRRERCAAAKERLLAGGDLLAVIAEELGFSCEYNFIRFFKSVEGMTPAGFRRAAYTDRLAEKK